MSHDVWNSRNGETVDAFLARVRASAFIGDIPVPPRTNKRAIDRRKKVVRLAGNLTREQLATLLDLAEGRAALLIVRGEKYAYWSEGFMRGMGPKDVRHSVTAESCSCKSFQFRGGECKHMEALRRYTEGQP